jgi:hypothetical protein
VVTDFEQIFLLSPLFVRDGLEGGQIGNAEGEELHFNIPAKNARASGPSGEAPRGAALQRFGCEWITPSWDALSSFAHFPNLLFDWASL